MPEAVDTSSIWGKRGRLRRRERRKPFDFAQGAKNRKARKDLLYTKPWRPLRLLCVLCVAKKASEASIKL